MSAERTLSYPGQVAGEQRAFPCAFLTVAFDCEQPLVAPVRLSLAEVERVRFGRGPARVWHRGPREGVQTLELFLADDWMSSEHATLELGPEGWILCDRNSKNGTFVHGVRVQEQALLDGDVIELGGTLCVYRSGAPRLVGEPADRVAAIETDAATSLNPELLLTLEPIPRLAAAGLPVVIGGETGTGKEVIARALHEHSGRLGAFVAINCGALSEQLITSELFGAVKGAFSGASETRAGLIRAAHGGTLLLDEIAELPSAAQVVLLRVIQEGEVVPVGGTRPTPVDVRYLAASHRSLAEQVEAGSFRRDLYTRLAGSVIELPPLRERREDIGTLVSVFLRRWYGVQASGITFEREAGRALLSYEWVGNVRELEQCVRASVALAGTSRVGLVHLPEQVQRGAAVRNSGQDETRRELHRLLGLHKGNVSAVARDMGKARVQIRRWCRRFDLDPEAFRDS